MIFCQREVENLRCLTISEKLTTPSEEDLDADGTPKQILLEKGLVQRN